MATSRVRFVCFSCSGQPHHERHCGECSLAAPAAGSAVRSMCRRRHVAHAGCSHAAAALAALVVMPPCCLLSAAGVITEILHDPGRGAPLARVRVCSRWLLPLLLRRLLRACMLLGWGQAALRRVRPALEAAQPSRQRTDSMASST